MTDTRDIDPVDEILSGELWKPGYMVEAREAVEGNRTPHNMNRRIQKQRSKSKSKRLKANIPGGSLGPGKIFVVESCHGFLLRVQTRLGFDTGHRKSSAMKEMERFLVMFWCVDAILPDVTGTSGNCSGPLGNVGGGSIVYVVREVGMMQIARR